MPCPILTVPQNNHFHQNYSWSQSRHLFTHCSNIHSVNFYPQQQENSNKVQYFSWDFIFWPNKIDPSDTHNKCQTVTASKSNKSAAKQLPKPQKTTQIVYPWLHLSPALTVACLQSSFSLLFPVFLPMWCRCKNREEDDCELHSGILEVPTTFYSHYIP